ncbi:mll1940 [Mesorhizobium japonicum MAFF 303099]|uniref:Mll1940 protein n=1 Tax=Mesorhizobium japonicum (strain LMG 29417 / CECT 9101 / MAFF 303099) TaxID=266835 RepID=Q98JH4_RHILO|nr:mll1940 [Mesorhizobium japonicum MAFF 303099]
MNWNHYFLRCSIVAVFRRLTTRLASLKSRHPAKLQMLERPSTRQRSRARRRLTPPRGDLQLAIYVVHFNFQRVFRNADVECNPRTSPTISAGNQWPPAATR